MAKVEMKLTPQILELMKTLLELLTEQSNGETLTKSPSVEPEVAATKKPLPAKKTKPVVEETEEEENENGNEEENDEEGSDEETGTKKGSKVKSSGPSKADVVKALQTFAANNTRAKAIKMLSKFGVTSVHDLPISKFEDLIDLLT